MCVVACSVFPVHVARDFHPPTHTLETTNHQHTHTHTPYTDDTTEFIDVHHRVLSCSLSHNRLLITTATRCMVVNPLAVNTPHTLDMAAPVVLMRQATSCFVVVDAGGGVQVLSYEARLLSHPTIPGVCRVGWGGERLCVESVGGERECVGGSECACVECEMVVDGGVDH